MFDLNFKNTFLALVSSACLGMIPYATPAAHAGSSIYDAQVLRYIALSGTQRSKVTEIVRQSDAEMARVFHKHYFDPSAKPDFDKLVAASSDLRALEKRERMAMQQILNKEQMKIYDQLMEYTAARVRKAAN